jgi:2-oxoglutarate ferredoxin oxidoreductase subunit beta
MTSISAPLATYRNERPYPFCPGCGHSLILNALDRALVHRGADPARVVIVTDIGCSGLSDQYFTTSAFHGLHGRSITYASGIKLARPDLDVIVIMGDGGTGIGGAHLINAARRNIGITVLVLNNFNFGMTGGQHSTTTPAGAITPTTPFGNLERPLDICGTVAVNGAGYVYRGTSFDEDLPDRIAEAMDGPGFALLDIWELCTAYFVRSNHFSRRAIDTTLADLGFATGLLARRPDAAEYSAAYRSSTLGGPSGLAPDPIRVSHHSSLDKRTSLLVAGSAGGRVRSAARLTAQAAISCGLFASQQDDYPVTVRTGHSVSALVVSPEPIDFAGVVSPDAVLVLSEDGLLQARPLLPRLGREATVFVMPEFADLVTDARIVVLDPARVAQPPAKADRALAALAAAVAVLSLFPVEAMTEAARGPHAPELQAAVEAGLAMARLAFD